MSTDLHTLSGAYALDALSAEEAEQFRLHLEACDACRQEVRELRHAAAQMGQAEAFTPPAHLRDRVIAAVDRTPQLPPPGRSDRADQAGPGAGRGDQGRAGQDNVVRVPRAHWGRRLLVAAAAVVIVAGGAIALSQQQADEPQLAEGVVRVFEADDANTARMETENGGEIAVATSPELGQMAVDTDELPELDDEHVYQLWAVKDGAMSSVGVLEREKGAAMDMPAPDIEVAITVEPVGGSEQPTTDPIMQVNPSSV